MSDLKRHEISAKSADEFFGQCVAIYDADEDRCIVAYEFNESTFKAVMSDAAMSRYATFKEGKLYISDNPVKVIEGDKSFALSFSIEREAELAAQMSLLFQTAVAEPDNVFAECRLTPSLKPPKT